MCFMEENFDYSKIMENKRKEIEKYLKNNVAMQDYVLNNNDKNLVINSYEIISLFCKYSSNSQINYVYKYLKNSKNTKSKNSLKYLLKLIGNNIFKFAILKRCLLSI